MLAGSDFYEITPAGEWTMLAGSIASNNNLQMKGLAFTPVSGPLGASSTIFGNCDGNDNNGFAAALAMDASHCGACATGCSAPAGGGSPSCVNGACVN